MAERIQIGEMVYKVTGDASGLKAELQKVELTAVKAGRKVEKGFGSTVSRALKGVAAVMATIGITRFFTSTLKAASAAEESASKFGVVFSNVAQQANAAAADLAANYGLARTEAKDLLSASGDLITGFGASQQAALDLSTRINKLAVDVTSFKNVQQGIPFSADAINKALLGEREQLKSLGIAISETDLKGFAEQQGLVWKETTRLQKAQLTLDLIYQRGANSVGDFARTQNSFANQMRIARANVQNLSESVGKNLLPVATLGVKAFNSFAVQLDKSAQELNAFVTSAQGARQIADIIGNIAGAFAAAKVIIEPVVEGFIDNMGILIDAFKDVLAPAGDSSGALTFFAGAVQFGVKVTRIFVLTLATAIKGFANLVRAIIDSGRVVADFYLALAGKKEWSEFKESAERAGGSFKKFGTDFVDDTKEVAGAISDLTGSFVNDTEKLSKDAANAYKRNSQAFRNSVYDVLTAKQEDAKQTKENVETSKKAAKTEKEIWESRKKELSGYISTVIASFNQINTLVSSVGQLFDALAQRRLDALDAQMQAELEAAGVAEETTVEQAQREYDAAVATGDALAVEEKRRALEKAKIEEKYQKQRAQLEYDAALTSWQFQVATAAAGVPIAAMQGLITGWQAPFPIGPVLGPIFAGLAGAAAALQLAAVVAAKPQAPKFAEGGIVPGGSYTGDQVPAMVNSGEMILNQGQQRQLFDIANGQATEGAATQVNLILNDTAIGRVFYRLSQNGDLFIDEKAIVTR